MDLQNNEIVKIIEGFPQYYITNFGRVWSENSKKWLKPTMNKRGNHNRLYVSLGRGNKKYIHRLVAEAFVPNPYNLEEVDHIDTNGLNNNADNLRWVTRSENMANPLTQEHVKKNTGYYLEIEEIATGRIFYGVKAVAEEFGISENSVTNHLQNKVKHPKWRSTGRRIRPE